MDTEEERKRMYLDLKITLGCNIIVWLLKSGVDL